MTGLNEKMKIAAGVGYTFSIVSVWDSGHGNDGWPSSFDQTPEPDRKIVLSGVKDLAAEKIRALSVTKGDRNSAGNAEKLTEAWFLGFREDLDLEFLETLEASQQEVWNVSEFPGKVEENIQFVVSIRPDRWPTLAEKIAQARTVLARENFGVKQAASWVTGSGMMTPKLVSALLADDPDLPHRQAMKRLARFQGFGGKFAAFALGSSISVREDAVGFVGGWDKPLVLLGKEGTLLASYDAKGNSLFSQPEWNWEDVEVLPNNLDCHWSVGRAQWGLAPNEPR